MTVWARRFSDGSLELRVGRDVVVVYNGREGHKDRVVFLRYDSGETIASVEIDAEFGSWPTLLIDEQRVFISGRGQRLCFGLGGDLLWYKEFGTDKGSEILARPGKQGRGIADECPRADLGFDFARFS